MSMTDPIADLLTRIRNAQSAHHETVEIPYSRLKKDLASVLKAEGFVKNLKVIQSKPADILHITLRYTDDNEAAIRGIKRISKPGCRVYVGCNDMPSIRGGFGVNILSTASGVMTGAKARKLNVGGEVLCQVW